MGGSYSFTWCLCPSGEGEGEEATLSGSRFCPHPRERRRSRQANSLQRIRESANGSSDQNHPLRLPASFGGVGSVNVYVRRTDGEVSG